MINDCRQQRLRSICWVIRRHKFSFSLSLIHAEYSVSKPAKLRVTCETSCEISKPMSPIISVGELFQIYKNDDVVIVDVSNSTSARREYQEGHIENSFFIDLNEDLANTGDPKFGGRHPLPDIREFLKVVFRLGITKGSRVIIYDKSNGANAAARFWWMLKSIGHNQVQLLDGGFQAAIEGGFPISSEIPKPKNYTDHDAEEWCLPLADIEAVKVAVNDLNQVIIDVRDEMRYNGVSEPIDIIAGHIPNAVNIPYKNNLEPSGHFKQPEDLMEVYSTYSNSNVIVHCGSGVTACHTLFAFHMAGLPIPKLYVGSWSEWSRN